MRSFQSFLVDVLINSVKEINSLRKEIVYSVKKCQILTQVTTEKDWRFQNFADII